MLNDGEMVGGIFQPFGVRGRGLAVTDPAKITGFADAYEVLGPSSPTLGETHMTSMMAWMIWRAKGDGLIEPTVIGRNSGASGRRLTEISPGSQCHRNGVTEIAAAVRLAGAKRIYCPAITFTHGEADRGAKMDPTAYLAGMLALIAAANADWRAVTGQSAPIRLYVSQLCANSYGHGSLLSQAQLEAAERSDLVRFVCPRYFLPTGPGSGEHLANVGYQRLGEYYAKAIFSDVIAHEKPHWLRPARVEFDPRSREVVYAYFDVPSPPLVLDTVGIAQGEARNMGFAFLDGAGYGNIASVALVADNGVKIMLSQASTGSNPTLQYAFNGPGFPDRSHFGAWGNLRDSDPTPSRLFAGSLVNWAPTFSVPIAG